MRDAGVQARKASKWSKVSGEGVKFLQANAPDPNRLPRDDIVGVTAILLTCLYTNKVPPPLLPLLHSKDDPATNTA